MLRGAEVITVTRLGARAWLESYLDRLVLRQYNRLDSDANAAFALAF